MEVHWGFNIVYLFEFVGIVPQVEIDKKQEHFTGLGCTYLSQNHHNLSKHLALSILYINFACFFQTKSHFFCSLISQRCFQFAQLGSGCITGQNVRQRKGKYAKMQARCRVHAAPVTLDVNWKTWNTCHWTSNHIIEKSRPWLLQFRNFRQQNCLKPSEPYKHNTLQEENDNPQADIRVSENWTSTYEIL